jgi:serpin B
LAPQVSGADVAGAADSVSTFGVSLLNKLTADPRGANDNVVFSPLSLYAALLMAHAGSQDDTLNQMSAVLQLTVPRQQAYPNFNGLSLTLDGRAQAAGEAVLKTTYGLFVEKQQPVLNSFLDTLATNFGAGVISIETATPAQAEASRTSVNAWFAERTAGKFKELLAPGALDLVHVVTANAVTFQGAWKQPFEQELTKRGDFLLESGLTKQADFMEQASVFAVKRGASYDAVELPFAGDNFALQLVLPKPGQLTAVEAALVANLDFDFLADAAPGFIGLRLPKFTYDASLPAVDLLRELGMVDAFESRLADFSGIDGQQGTLYISDVVHKAAIAVDEKGAEASAGSAVIIGPGNMPTEILSFDRPFYFAIRDVQTGALVFLGRVMNPT